LSENWAVYDVLAHIFVHDVVALNIYVQKTPKLRIQPQVQGSNVERETQNVALRRARKLQATAAGACAWKAMFLPAAFPLYIAWSAISSSWLLLAASSGEQA